jgi:hypothetical protein
MFRPLALLLLTIGLLLPHRLRILYASAVAYIIQGITYAYYRLFIFVLTQAQGEKVDDL